MTATNVCNPGEVWKDVPNYEGHYQVSNLGRMRSLDRPPVYKARGARGFTGQPLSPNANQRGYLCISLSRKHKYKRFFVHRIVMHAFVGPIPDGYTVNHKNGIKDDNRLENLEYVTQAENNAHAFRTGLRTNKGYRPYNALTDQQAAEFKKLRQEGWLLKPLSKMFNISMSTASGISRGLRYSWVSTPISSER
ncbi:NUMOD4 motif-containing HNH endonuclease [Larkinella ripae]